jgi:hypothetical protein
MYLDVSNLYPMYTWVHCNPFLMGVEDVAHDAQLPTRKIVERHCYCSVNICDKVKCAIIYVKVILTTYKFLESSCASSYDCSLVHVFYD